MSKMLVNEAACTLCGSCLDSCPFGAIEIEEKVTFNESCQLCQLCVDACPEGAISLQEGDGEGVKAVEDNSAYAGVLVFIEQQAGRVHPVSYEMIGKGMQLARALQQPIWCVIAGRNIQAQAQELLWYGVDGVYVYDQPELEHFTAMAYTEIVEDAVTAMHPAIMLIGATHLGRSLAPRVATRLRTGLTADCTSLDVRPNGDLVQTRPAFGGNVMARIITPRHRPQMATVRYKVMEKAARVPAPHGQIVQRNAPALSAGVRVLRVVQQAQAASITEADVVVAAGRGAGNARGLALVQEMATSLGGVMGASRPLVEQGLASHAQQVGLSGRTVRPKLYVACGISGAVQHLAGMRGADTIIAINKDKDAPIFEVAHVAIVGDLFEIIPRVVEMIGGRSVDAQNAVS